MQGCSDMAASPRGVSIHECESLRVCLRELLLMQLVCNSL